MSSTSLSTLSKRPSVFATEGSSRFVHMPPAGSTSSAAMDRLSPAAAALAAANRRVG